MFCVSCLAKTSQTVLTSNSGYVVIDAVDRRVTYSIIVATLSLRVATSLAGI